MLRPLFLTALTIIFSISALHASEEAAGYTTILKHEGETIVLIDSDTPSSQALRLELRLSGSGVITLGSDDEFARLRFSAGEEQKKVIIHPGTAGFFPNKVSISAPDNNYDLYSAGVFTTGDNLTPLPADIGHIIFSDFDSSRRLDWELYRWNLIPEVLIFDTSDYEVQSRFFKRLAFFVEKPGYVGTLVSDEKLVGKHGWNAHDYKADDLAAFFSEAGKQDFNLNPEELILRQVLIDNKIIITPSPGDTAYKEGVGAVLSVSRETLPNWRYRFLTHECLHGIFFTDAEFRVSIEEVFNSLAPGELEFWKRLLDYRRYDVNNRYLLINEFMAYSLQQPVNDVDDYFKGFLYDKMTTARPYETNFVADFNRNYPESFRQAVSSLGEVLYDYTGREPGHLANLYPENLSQSFFNLFPSVK